jgi:hypothetical protein
MMKMSLVNTFLVVNEEQLRVLDPGDGLGTSDPGRSRPGVNELPAQCRWAGPHAQGTSERLQSEDSIAKCAGHWSLEARRWRAARKRPAIPGRAITRSPYHTRDF